MPVTTLSSRAFNQDTSGAKRAALAGPVFITDRGKPAHVLLSFKHYQRVLGGKKNIADLLAMPGKIDFDIPVFKELARTADLS